MKNQRKKNTKQKFRPLLRVKKIIKKKKNQHRIFVVFVIIIISFLLGMLLSAIDKQNKQQVKILQNQSVIKKTQKDIKILKNNVSEQKIMIESDAKIIEDKTKKQSELESKVEELTEINNQLKSYGSGIGGASVNVSQSAVVASDNAYGYGYCTWYVKNKRPDIGSYWGDAKNWYNSAISAGYSTGSSPKVGAIGVSFGGEFGHVIYVEAVNASTVTISEMNYTGWNVMSTREVLPSEFSYIYDKV